MTAPKIILASASSIRSQILNSAGIDFSVSPSNIDENTVKKEYISLGRGASDIVLKLANDKAVAIRADADDLVVGADQVLEFKGEIFDKPKTMTETKNRLLLLRGQEHRLIGAVCLVQNGVVLWHYASICKLTMRNFSDRFLQNYLKQQGKSVLSCVGGYKFEAYGAQLFEKCEGDYTSVLGLSLLPLLKQLRLRGAILS